MALTVTGTGGLCLLAGVLVLGHIVGSYDLDVVLAAGDVVRAHALYLPALVLVLLGALTKSAQFPFHFWLPHAMAAPTPVSAYLHSATMVKAGVFLLARLWPVLSGTEQWFWIVGGAGLSRCCSARYVGDLPARPEGRCWPTRPISHLGLITLLLGLNSPLAAVAAVFHMMNHATFKASLFMAVGIIDHETGTRDIAPPAAALCASCRSPRTLAIGGGRGDGRRAAAQRLPVEGDVLRRDGLRRRSTPWIEIGLPAVATLAGMFAVAYSLRFVHDVFFGRRPPDLPRTPHEPRALDARAESSCWCSPAWSWASLPACIDRPAAGDWPRAGGRRPACPTTASPSGTASTRRC